MILAGTCRAATGYRATHVETAGRGGALSDTLRVHALAADNRGRALVQTQRNGSRHLDLGGGDERVIRLTLDRPPAALVYEVRIPWCDEILGGERAAVED